MFRSLYIAFSFIRIPKLFLQLILGPLLLGLSFVIVQGLVIRAYMITSPNINAQSMEQQIADRKDSSMFRYALFGSSAPLKPLKICRWAQKNVKKSPVNS